jgi:hypothetical protein
VSTDVAITLRRAAHELRERGWCRGTLVDGARRHCLLGAIDEAAHRIRTPEVALDLGNACLAVERYLGTPDIANWNDAAGRTADQVVALLEAVADQEDAHAGIRPLVIEGRANLGRADEPSWSTPVTVRAGDAVVGWYPEAMGDSLEVER